MSSARYQLSKLLQIFCVRELAARSKASGKSNVIIDCTNPGLCHSELSREGILILEIVKFLLARTTEHGSRSMVNAAASGQETHGTYLSDCRVSNPAPMVLNDPQTQQKVWDEVSRKLERIQPGTMKNI